MNDVINISLVFFTSQNIFILLFIGWVNEEAQVSSIKILTSMGI